MLLPIQWDTLIDSTVVDTQGVPVNSTIGALYADIITLRLKGADNGFEISLNSGTNYIENDSGKTFL